MIKTQTNVQMLWRLGFEMPSPKLTLFDYIPKSLTCNAFHYFLAFSINFNRMLSEFFTI